MRNGDYFLRSTWEELSVDQRKSVVVYLKMMGYHVASGWDEFDADYLECHEQYITITEAGRMVGLYFSDKEPPGTELTLDDLQLMAKLGMYNENQ